MRSDPGIATVKLAYLIICHKNPQQVIDLIRLIDRRGDYVLIQCNARSGTGYQRVIEEGCKGTAAEVIFAEPRKITWGAFSLVEPYLQGIATLLRHAKDWSFAINLTGQCLPTQPIAALDEFLSKQPNTNFLEYADLQTEWPKAAYRLKTFYVEFAGRLFNSRIPRALPRYFRPFGGLDLSMLSRAFCEYFTYSTEARRIIRHMRFAQLPEELWSQSVLMNSPFRDTVISDSKRLILWPEAGAPNPLILTMRHWDQLTSPAYFFARKFDPEVDEQVIVALADRVRPGSRVVVSSLANPPASDIQFVQGAQSI
jgi:hypothetical protein